MIKRAIKYCFLLLMLSGAAYGQGENNVWCFGTHCKADFNGGNPVFFADSLVNDEGSSSICDPYGNLLFYASCEKAWDRNNNLMPNGTGLLGGNSATQGSVIIQSFANSDQYYLFVLQDDASTHGYLYYSVVDMTLNGGLGDIVTGQKNILLDSNLSEKMFAVSSLGCSYAQLLVHERSHPVFHVHKIDAAGIHAPVISTSGFNNNVNGYQRGEMKVSPDNSAIALVAGGATQNIELLSFDVATGIVSNAISLDTAGLGGYFGISYSPDGSKLYAVGQIVDLVQYDVSLLPNVLAVKNSETVISNANFNYQCMRIGPDNKIYTPGTQSLSVINNPNLPGPACNFVLNGVPIPTYPLVPVDVGISLGDPSIASTGPTIKTSQDTTLCLGIIPLTLHAPNGYNSYTWSDGSTQSSDTITSAGTKWVVSSSNCVVRVDTFHVHAAHIDTTITSFDTSICFAVNSATLTAPGGYTAYLWTDNTTQQTNVFTGAAVKWVYAQTGCNMLVDTFNVAAHLDTTKHVVDTAVCLVNNVPVFSPGPGYTTYIWSDGKITPSDTMGQAGTKWVRAQVGCNMVVDTFKLHAVPIATTGAVKDTNVCFANNVPILTAAPGYNTYLWSDGKTTQQDSMSQPGTKWVQCQTGCTMLVDTFHLHDWRDTTKMVLDTTHCVAYSPIPVVAPGGYTSYLWSDGKIGQADTFFSTSTKWVTALNGCNMLIDTVHFTATTVPQDSVFEHATDTTMCFEAGSITVNAPAGYTLYLWNDGTNTQGDVFNNAGTKWVYAQKLCYLLIDTFAVQSQGTDTLAGRVDTMICFSSGTALSAVSGYNTYLWSDGSAGITDTFSQTSIKRVYAHRACEERVDTFHVQFINDLSVDLGADTAICKGESVQLNATSMYNTAKYLWQDGSTNATYTATDGGDYSVKVSVGPCNVSDTIRVHQKVIDIKLRDGLIPCHQESITLDAGVDNASYLWQDGSTQRTYKATKEGSYSVKVTQDECSASATATVRFEGCPCNVVIPTAFSPNNDSKNDKFGLTVSCPINSFRMMIYNRWGNQVFYSEDVNQKWDGTYKGIAVDGDVFNYYLEFKDGDNKTYNYKGNVTLVR